MTAAEQRCLLKSLDTTYNDISIWSEDAITIGRSRDTLIKDKKCSKQQGEYSFIYI